MRLLSDRRGGVAVEFSLCLIPLLVLVGGAITYAGVLNIYLTGQHAASVISRSLVAAIDDTDRRRIFDEAVSNVAPTVGNADCASFSFNDAAGVTTVIVRFRYDDNCAPVPRLLPTPAELVMRSVVVRES